jgi:hypothetical protein
LASEGTETAGSRRQRGTLAILISVLAIGAAIWLHFVKLSSNGARRTVAQWHTLCTTIGQVGQSSSGSAQPRCGEVSLAYHASAGLVVLAVVLGSVGTILLRLAGAGRTTPNGANQRDNHGPASRSHLASE